ncbi:MAG TPA: protein-glutamate O-methyltransferase CheR [Vicinamibacterales bacterium]|nr:protein-glutamate O-methyltransferase CheR [Vicinamibacterales bacterium]
MDSLARERRDRAGARPVAATSVDASLSDRDLTAILRLVYEKSGIALHRGKRALVAARLQKRVTQTGCATFGDYVRYLRSDATGAELTVLLDAIATHHTAFFREPQHFEFLARVVLPPLRARAERAPILGWSAACSSGEEPYTIAMIAFEQFGHAAAERFRLLASDLSMPVLERAARGVYRAERVGGLPRYFVLKYFERPFSPANVVQVVDPLKRLVEFRQLNLLDPPPPGRPLDFIFCRNALIYFDRDTQQRVVRQLEARLAPGGYLFTSHSESLNSLAHGLTWVAPAVYRRDAA